VLIAVLGACSPRLAVESAALLSDLGAGEVAVSRRLAHPFEVAERGYRGDLYPPPGQAGAALVLVPGVTPAGKDDPRLVRFAQSLSRAGFLVLVPEIENLRDLKVGPGDITAIGDAVSYLAGFAKVPEVGLVAISYAAGPALIVALEAPTRERVGVLAAVGGYYDIQGVITFFTTGYFRRQDDSAWRQLQPNPYGKWIFLRSNLDRIADPRDRALLSAIAERRLDDPQAEVADLAARLGSEGETVYDLLVNGDPERVGALIAGLPDALRDDLWRLDPRSHDLGALSARLLLVHGREDRVIPFTESQRLDGALPEGQAELYLVGSLAHVDLSPLGLVDFLTLWRAAYRLLVLRDSLPRPAGAALRYAR
jgi:pimeloyl-ACP methyl ester carboxylesterase